MIVTAEAHIHLNAILENLAFVRSRLPGKKALAVIKSDAYGHGLLPVAKSLDQKIDAFAVACLNEALQLRASGINANIVVMRGFNTEKELQFFLDDPRLIASIHDSSQLRLLDKITIDHPVLSIWLKLDTGMHRLGFTASEFDLVYQRLVSHSFLHKNFVLYSHLADAENTDRSFTLAQLQLFQETTEKFNNPKSLLNSAGIIAYPEAAYDWIRPGALLYGISPFTLNEQYHHELEPLRPAMTLSSCIIAIKQVGVGDQIGYGCNSPAARNMRIAIVGIGYGDGYPRHIQAGAPTLVQGCLCPCLGRVSMDMLAIDVSALSSVSLNDRVVLWGEDSVSVNIVARYMNTTPHELPTRLGKRVKMLYLF